MSAIINAVSKKLSYSSSYAALNLFWGFYLATVITASLDLASYGAYTLVVAATSISISVSTFRAAEILVRFSEELRDFDAKVVIKLFLLDAIPLIVFLFLAFNIISVYFPSKLQLYKYVITYSMLEVSKTVVMGIYQVTGRMKNFYIAQMIGVLFSIIYLSYYFFSSQSLDFQNTIKIALSGIAVANLISVVKLFFLGLNPDRNVFQKVPSIRAIVSRAFLFKLWISSVVKAGNNRAEAPLMAYMLSYEALGLYSLLKQFLSPLSIFTSQLSNNLSYRVSSLALNGKFEKLLKSIKSTNRETAVLIVPLGIGAVLMSNLYIFMFVDESLLTSETILLSLLIYISVLVSFGQWWTRPVAIAVNPTISILGNCLAALIVLLGIPVFVTLWGLIGVPVLQIIRHVSIKYYFVKKVFGA